MNLKLLIALLSTGIVVLLGGTAVVASLPAGTTGAKVTTVTSTTPPVPSPSTTSVARSHRSTTHSTSVTVPPTTTSTVLTEPPSTTSTDFVLVTISYAVKPGDSVTSIAKWFDQHGYGVQFGANLQVIDSNKNLLVPGAIISISNGVMTIHSPV